MNDIAAPSETAIAQAPEKEEGSFLVFVFKLAVFALLFRSFAFAAFSIPSESMLPNLANGDYLVASNWAYGLSKNAIPFDTPLPEGHIFAHQPDRGDIAIFKHPVGGVDYIKRVIGLPGDMVEIRSGQIILNGEPVKKQRIEDFVIPVTPNTQCHPLAEEISLPGGAAGCRYSRYRETLPSGESYTVLDFGPMPQDDYPPVVVPEGTLFMMGDNRDNSQDSRFRAEPGGGVGLVPRDKLVGRAEFVAFSTDGGSAWIKPWTWFTAARWGRIGDGLWAD